VIITTISKFYCRICCDRNVLVWNLYSEDQLKDWHHSSVKELLFFSYVICAFVVASLQEYTCFIVNISFCIRVLSCSDILIPYDSYSVGKTVRNHSFDRCVVISLFSSWEVIFIIWNIWKYFQHSFNYICIYEASFIIWYELNSRNCSFFFKNKVHFYIKEYINERKWF